MRLSTRIAYKLLPPHAWSEILREWSLVKRRWFNSRTQAKRVLASGRKLRLHLGCGKLAKPGWINIDAFEQPGMDLRWDLRDPLPCTDGVAELIYSEHVLEHLEIVDARAVLREIHRLLEPGGTARLGVPDAGLYLENYAKGNSNFFSELRHLGGAVEPLETPLEVINQMFRMGGHHRFAWDFETLSLALRKAGFTDIQQYPPGTASRPDLCLDDPDHAIETLYIEAKRPA